uniref:hypothetical protein n=1 Tax=Agathobacter sp. TaxID=2021311 RepID=UPI004057040C
MEKTWNDFWMTGKVEDYLSYKNSTQDGKRGENPKETKKEQKGQNIHGTVSGAYRDGAR